MNTDVLNNIAHMSYGIYVLTTRFEDTINGMIASTAQPIVSFWLSAAFAPSAAVASIRLPRNR